MKKIVLLVPILAAASMLAIRAQAQVIVIANESVNATEVSKNEVRDVFTGASANLRNGTHVTPVVLKVGAAHEEFLAAYVGKSDTAFRAGWRALVFSGQTNMPKSFDGEAAVVEYVARTPGAIGYIGKSAAHPGVKVLAIK